MKVSVTGGAGYIGSHITLGLIDKNFDVKFTKARDGDPSTLISDSQKMKNKYKWQLKYNNIEKIINSSLS